MKNLAKVRDFLFLLIIVYSAQGGVYARGSFISQVSLALILSISGVYLLKTLFQQGNKNLFYKAMVAFIILNIFGAILTGDITDEMHFGQLKNTLFVSLPFFPFYYIAQKGLLRSKNLLRLFFIMLPIAIIGFYANRAEILSIAGASNIDLVNNSAYTFVFLLPFVFLLKKNKFFSVLCTLIIFFFIIQGAKRGALIAGAMGGIFFIYNLFKSIEKKNKAKSYLITIISIVLLSWFAVDFYQNNEYIVSRMSTIGEEGGSGRDEIYGNLFNSWYKSDSVINMLFGFGFASSLKLSGFGLFAHNDWLELLTSFGILGITIYAAMFYGAVKFVFKSHVQRDKKIHMLAVLSIWFIVTMVSMNYADPNAVFQMVILAYLVGNTKPNKKKNLNVPLNYSK